MVNYKRVVCEVVMLVAMVTVTAGAPAADCTDKADKHYDQRQNGTENYRLNIDGVVIAVAPVDSLLAAASDIDLSDILGEIEDYSDLQKPSKPSKPSLTSTLLEPKPQDVKPEEPKPQDVKPEEPKPESSAKPEETPLSNVSLDSDVKSQKKEASTRKQEKAQRLKHRLANILLPLLRKTRHH